MRYPRLGSALLLALVAVGGCGDDDQPSADPSTSPVTSTASPASASPSASASASSSPSASPSSTPSATAPVSTYDGVAPATGPVIRGPISEIRAPEGWGDPLQDSTGGNVDDPDADIAFNVLLEDAEVPRPDPSTDGLAELTLGSSGIEPPLQRVDDIVIAGQPAFHLTGIDDIFGNYVDVYGFYYRGHAIDIQISTPEDLPQSERDALIGTVLASFTLTG